MTNEAQRYIIISPVRDEERYLETTILSVISQTIKPREWIVVDDGSSDSTSRIARLYAAQHQWIKVVHRRNRGQRVPGTGVMEAFYDGYHTITALDWEYLAKLDGDVKLAPTYFERCFEEFQKDPSLGMCGGRMYRLHHEHLKMEPHPIFHVRGPIKLYRRACWQAIGGLIVAPGWDTVDEVQANRLGWKTKTIPELKVLHQRSTGAVQGFWKDGIKMGRAAYISAYHPAFMFAKCIKRVFQWPYGLCALAHAYGFVSGYAKKLPQVEDRAFVKYVRQQQVRRLLLRKSIWR